MMTFSVSLISVNDVVSSNSSNIVTLSVVNGISSWSSVFIKTVVVDCVDVIFGAFVVIGNFSVLVVVGDVVVVVVVVDALVCGFFVDGFVAVVSIVLGFDVGFLVTGALLDEFIGFRVGNRVVSTI